jgi:hypothetical protein
MFQLAQYGIFFAALPQVQDSKEEVVCSVTTTSRTNRSLSPSQVENQTQNLLTKVNIRLS